MSRAGKSEPIQCVRRGLSLVPVTERDRERVRQLPTETPLNNRVTCPRNYPLLQKAHCLIALAFEYWEPDTIVSRSERQAVERLTRLHVQNGMPPDQAGAVRDHYLAYLERTRGTLEADKSIEQFRHDMTIEAGHYTTVATVNGIRRVPMSWSYVTDEQTFQAFYRDLFNACWRVALSAAFDTAADADAAAVDLMRFA